MTNSARNTVANKSALIRKKHYRLRLTFPVRLPTPSQPSLYQILLSIFLFVGLFQSAFAASCNTKQFDRRAIVTHVYDGDTVKLANGDRIRLIGINTPEMNYDTGTPEPYAKKAKRLLEKLTLNKKIGLKLGKESKDRYKRILGHAYLLDGTNVQYRMLMSGLAFHINIPPNLNRQNCYKTAENLAKRNRIGLWKSPYYRPVMASKINKSHLGFKRVSGIVSDVLETKKTVWLKLSKKMSLRIDKKDLHYFNNFSLDSLRNKRITAHGWVSYYKKRFSMRIKHPDAISM